MVVVQHSIYAKPELEDADQDQDQEQERVSRPTGEDITTKASGVMAGSKLERAEALPVFFVSQLVFLFLVLIGGWRAAVYIISFALCFDVEWM